MRDVGEDRRGATVATRDEGGADERSAEQRFAGRVAVVTGGAAGIGLAPSAAGVRGDEGAGVVIVDVDEDQPRRARHGELGVDSVARGPDARGRGRSRWSTAALERHGQIDILVNLAGIYPFAASIQEETLAGWKRLLEVNLDATFLCCKHVLPHMRERRYGRIVNTSSGTVNIGAARAARRTSPPRPGSSG